MRYFTLAVQVSESLVERLCNDHGYDFKDAESAVADEVTSIGVLVMEVEETSAATRI